MKSHSALAIFILIVATIACQSAATPIPPAAVSLEDQVQTAAAGIALTQAAAAPVEQPTQILIPTNTAIPAIPTTAPIGEHYAWNNVGSQDSGGVVIEIARFVLADKSAIPDMDFSLVSSFDDKPIVAEIIFKVTNTTQQTLSVYPDQGTVVVGGEQIDLTEYMMLATFGDSVGGEIFPGVTKIGGIWFGIKRSTLPEIQNVIITFGGPSDSNFSSIGSDYSFTIDLTNRQDQPLPEELK